MSRTEGRYIEGEELDHLLPHAIAHFLVTRLCGCLLVHRARSSCSRTGKNWSSRENPDLPVFFFSLRGYLEPCSRRLFLKQARMRNPHRRLTMPEDVARCIAALCHPATYWMTGNTLHVDGGENVVG